MASIKGSDDKAKYVKRIVHETEKNMAAVHQELTSYLRNVEKLRGKRLSLAVALKQFSETESPNLESALMSTAEAMVDIEEYRKYMHDRMQIKVAEPVKMYKTICTTLMEEVKNREQAVQKEQRKHAELEKTAINDTLNRQKISKTFLEIETASQNLVHMNHALTDNVAKFHERKIADVKSILNEMIYSEMQYHAKALEVLTNLQGEIVALDFQSDLDDIFDRMQVERSASILNEQ
ncbi:hypothetical protein MIR68_004753 [Amoeboaphelidium protococcarum]|nr:hypothetical protein MIR68_004753 [Amoeboaphelidium protococcarum]KAI3653459.1 hypothetical protein MP228_001406 [Amoeboaphelidium protococcarum]